MVMDNISTLMPSDTTLVLKPLQSKHCQQLALCQNQCQLAKKQENRRKQQTQSMAATRNLPRGQATRNQKEYQPVFQLHQTHKDGFLEYAVPFYIGNCKGKST